MNSKIMISLLSLFMISFISAQGLIIPDTSTGVDVSFYTGNLTNLSELADVNIPTPSDDEVLTYDSATSSWISSGLSYISKWIVDSSDGFLSNDSDTIYFNSVLLNDTIDARDTNTLYTAGSNLTLTGTSFAANMTSLKDYFDNYYTNSSFTGAYSNLTGVPTLLSNFTDDLGDRGYTSLSNFTNDPGYLTSFTETDPFWTANQSSYFTSADVITYINANDTTVNNSMKAYVDSLNHDGITWAIVVNGTMLSQEDWNTNYTANNNAWLDTTNLTYAAFNSSGLIQDWNSTGFIINWTPEINLANTSIYDWVVAQGYSMDAITWAIATNGTLALSSDLGDYIPYTSSNQNVALGDYNFSVGTSDFFVNSNGNVGIGTTNPGSKLTVSGGDISLDDDQYINWDGGMDNIRGTGDYLQYTSFWGHIFGDHLGEAMRIKDGNIGIGTAAPSEKLHINNGNFRMDNTFPQLQMFESDAAADNKHWEFNVNGEQLRGRVVNDALNASSDWLNVDRTGTTVDYVSFPNGNVGIGTTTPLSTLDVYGNGIFSGLTNNSRYLNFGDIVGETGYGLRNRLGVIETKDNGDTNWQAVGTICPATMVDTDGNVYDVVKIGNQCWMAENLNVGTRIDGVDEMADTGTIEKYCYGDDEANCTTYGGLYQWDEMMQYTETEGTQGICSIGWHIPTDAEQNTLDQYLTAEGCTCDADRSGDWDCAPAGTALKELGSSDFEALLSGYRYTNSNYDGRGTHTYLWSSTVGTTGAWVRYLSSSESSVYRFDHNKANGFSVRCLKDTDDSTLWLFDSLANIGDTNVIADSDKDSDGDILFRTGNEVKMVVENGGNVGIGTTAPGAKLEVSGTPTVIDGASVITAFTPSNGFARFAWWDPNSPNMKMMFGSGFADNTRFGINIKSSGNFGLATERFSITSDGNVGIGTTAPGNKLHVEGGDIKVSPTSNIADAELGKIGFGPGTTAYASYLPAYISSNFGSTVWNGVDLRFFTHPGPDITVGSPSEKMRIDKDGNVGIGTTAPNQELQVIGDANITGTVYYGSLQANSPILYYTDDNFTVEIKKATNQKYYIEYVDENLETQREWVNCTTATEWYQIESCEKLETTKLRHQLESLDDDTYASDNIQNITHYKNVTSEEEICEEILILNATNETEEVYETQCRNETRIMQEPYEIEELVNTTKKLKPADYIFDWVTKTAKTIIEMFYDEMEDWQSGVNYNIGDKLKYNNIAYEVIQEHTSQSDWTPDKTYALYSTKFYIENQNSGEIIEEWVQPTGGHDAYNIGDLVLYNGSTYESLINGNVWSPVAYPSGWKVTE